MYRSNFLPPLTSSLVKPVGFAPTPAVAANTFVPPVVNQGFVPPVYSQTAGFVPPVAANLAVQTPPLS
jgi:hypothetical protein